MSGMSERVAYIIGNGPSRKSVRREKLGQGVVYACNLSGRVYEPDYLFAVDPWCQYDLIKCAWPNKLCFTDFSPIPIDIPFEAIIADAGIPAHYDQIIHNPEQRAVASGWHFYSTGDLTSWQGVTDVAEQDYWRPNRTYVCFVPSTLQIENLTNMEDPADTILAPTGAYALRHACVHGHERIEIYGFDAIAGNYSSVSRDASSDTDRMRRFLKYYDRITKEYEKDIEFVWHTC